MKKYFLIALFSIFLCPFSIYALDSSENINVYMFPHELTSDDKLQDGSSGEQFKLADNTLLIWVDQHPEAKFAHPTVYILISSDGTRVEHGMWWPVLNGKQILYGSRNKLVMISPFEVCSFTGFINVYAFPRELTPKDKLVDGSDAVPFKITGNTLLIWVDLHPDMKFTHPTEYILIAPEEINVYKGGWWPVLNGKRILYGSRNKVGAISPFEL
ncbi:MAG: hypothetical protein LWX52_15435 [Deltaproteobacteria bacterium]|jgi:hypothetical protein|nr:hypothetical protein [Deltaproteobacteria bacterium]